MVKLTRGRHHSGPQIFGVPREISPGVVLTLDLEKLWGDTVLPKSHPLRKLKRPAKPIQLIEVKKPDKPPFTFW